MLEMLAPGFFGGRPGPQMAPIFMKLGAPTSFPLPLVPSVFVGAPLAALALAGVRASRAARIITASAVVLLWLALGVHLGAEEVLRGVPIWGSFRYAEKLVGPLTLCLALLAAFGADRIADRPRVYASYVAAVFGLLAAILAVWPGAEDLLRRTIVADIAPLVRERLAVGLAHASVGLGLLAGVIAAASRPGVRGHFPAIAAGLVFLQSAAASPFALHVGTRGVSEEHPLKSIREAGHLMRIAVPTQSVLGLGPEYFDEWDRLVAVLSRMGEVPYNVPAGIDQVSIYTGLVPGRFWRVNEALKRDFGPGRWVAWRRFGLTHVVVGAVAHLDPEEGKNAQAASSGGRPILQDRDWGFTVWEVPHRPWAFFAEQAVAVASEPAAYQRLADVLVSGGSEVVLEGPLPSQLAPGRVIAARRGAEWLRIEAETEHDGLLVINDAFWPGWKATIDGHPTPIRRADVLVRAVAWPAGRHVLDMRYDPPEVQNGLLVTAIGIAALLVTVALSRKWREGSDLPDT